ncbi:30S ribosomal protein S4 [Candidatus Saccharibacteria bacterium]|nr:30S ribosomal protein S4 [Candidatus Saccharibacteria bacterium]
MARDLSSIVKQSRRESYALHPKAHKVLVKRVGPPGQQGTQTYRRTKSSQYGLQLREKQKVKRLYGLLEKQFANLLEEAVRRKGQSGTMLLEFLERRLDNVIYRSGLAVSRRAARQLVTHGHFMLNGRRVDIPSIRVKVGDKITLHAHAKKNEYFKHLDELSPPAPSTPTWIKVDRKQVQLSVNGLPSRDDAESDIKEQLIIEYYSR